MDGINGLGEAGVPSLELQARPSGGFLFKVTRDDHPWSLNPPKSNASKMRFKPTLSSDDPAIEHATRRLHTACRRDFCLRQLVAVTRQWPLLTEP